MIVEQLGNARMYSGLGDRIVKVLNFLKNTDLGSLAQGTYEVDGMDVYAKVVHYETKPKAEGIWEAHHKYFDVQYVIEGEELFGWAPLATMQRGDYDETIDFEPLQGEGDFLRFRAGTFIIARPHVAHMATIAVSEPRAVKKVVVKVLA